MEREQGIDISPLCDRHTASIAKSQVCDFLRSITLHSRMVEIFVESNHVLCRVLIVDYFGVMRFEVWERDMG